MRVTTDALINASGPGRPARIMFASGWDAAAADALTQILIDDGYQVEFCGHGRDLLARVAQRPPDLLIMDLGLPGADGLTVCRQLRARWPLPIVTLGPIACEESGMASFQAGADGHVRVPCEPGELAVRVRSLLRLARAAAGRISADADLLVDGELRLDLRARLVTLDSAQLKLTAREFDLLAYLMTHPRRALTREQLLAAVWNWTFGDTSTVTVHVRRLRTKLERDHSQPHRIVTVQGVGYRYEPAFHQPSRGGTLRTRVGAPG